jgi:uncharacterized protein
MDGKFLLAGRFSSWLYRVRKAQLTENGIDVSCGECTACCRSSLFIHIRPEETRTLVSIPKELLFPAPGLSKGNMVLGYDEKGRCPMLINDRCSIYEHRPFTCRTYDCRIFAATGVAVGDDDKALITHQVKRWKFSFPAKRDRTRHSAVQAAVTFLQEYAGYFPAGTVPFNSPHLAVLAIKTYSVFFKYVNTPGKEERVLPVLDTVKAVMKANVKFEARRNRFYLYRMAQLMADHPDATRSTSRKSEKKS